MTVNMFDLPTGHDNNTRNPPLLFHGKKKISESSSCTAPVVPLLSSSSVVPGAIPAGTAFHETSLPKIPVTVRVSKNHLPTPFHQTVSSFHGQRTNDFVTLTYLDECKKEHECISTMMSGTDTSQTSLDAIPEHTLIHCYWCHHPFPYRPIGIPLSYLPHRVHKKYFSEISQDVFILRENIHNHNAGRRVPPHDTPEKPHDTSSYLVEDRDYYLTDGIFCSFNCAMAFIHEHRHDPLYTHSETLLNKIYYEIRGMKSVPIEPSPSWRLLRNYGGHLTIEDFRRNLFKIDYRPMGNILLPTLRSVGFLFEKQIRI